MKLQLDLENLQDVKDAHQLLTAWLELRGAAPASSAASAEAGSTAPSPPPASADSMDPAIVFGGAVAQTPLPTPAPSTAGVGLLPTAPGAGTAILTTIVPGLPTAAPMPDGSALPAAAQTLAPAPVVDLDKAGLPWDERIHAGTKSKKADGSWKSKPGVDKSIVPGIEAELRARVAAAGASAMPAPATGVALPPISSPAATDPATFEQLMARTVPAIAQGVLPGTAVAAACTSLGIPTVLSLHTDPTKVPQVWAALKAGCPGLQ